MLKWFVKMLNLLFSNVELFFRNIKTNLNLMDFIDKYFIYLSEVIQSLQLTLPCSGGTNLFFFLTRRHYCCPAGPKNDWADPAAAISLQV